MSASGFNQPRDPPHVLVDADQLATFVTSLFRYAEDGYVSFRAFDQAGKGPPTVIRSLKMNGGGLQPIIDTAVRIAQDCAKSSRPSVFAPPICLFSNPDRAAVADIGTGLEIAVEVDEGDTNAACQKLQDLLGPATPTMNSGGEWSDPETGEVFDKKHIHFRLSEPTQTQEDHAKLRHARDLAARFVGADPTGKPVCHPLRWAGSINCKGAPKIATIVVSNPDAEVHLDEAIAKLEEAVESAGMASVGMPESSDPRAADSVVASAMTAIPNPGTEVHYDDWIRFGYAIHRATAGTGFAIFEAWSQKSDKFEPTETADTWRRVGRAILASPVQSTVGAGTIFWYAKQAGWTRPEPELPPEIDDPGYFESVEADAGADKQDKAGDAKSDHVDPFPLLSAAEFMATFTNPDYLVDGIIQRGRLHALTSPTGHGKTAAALYVGCSVATGRDVGHLEVVQGEVIFLAGENPDDLCGRFWAACQSYGIDPNKLPMHVQPGNFPMDAETAETLKQKINATGRPISAAAYFHGDDDNQNVQMGAFARNLRVLTQCTGNPAVLVLCHPIKNPSKDNLIPRGGGAFLNEVDVNLTLWADTQDTTTLHWHGKIRGADFHPVNLALKQVKLAEKMDAKGRPFVSIVAALQTSEEAEKAIKQATTDENIVLEALRRNPAVTVEGICTSARWVSDKGVPNKAKVHRLLKSLDRSKLAKNWRGQMANYRRRKGRT